MSFNHYPTLNRCLAAPLLRLCLKTPLTPNQLTYLSLVCAAVGAVAFAAGTWFSMLYGAFGFLGFYLLDTCDGAVARHRGQESAWGARLDTISGMIAHVITFVGITAGLVRSWSSSLPWWLALSAGSGIMGCYAVVNFRRSQLRREQQLSSAVKPDDSAGALGWIIVHAEDFPFLVLAVALVGGFGAFLWAAAIGSHVFWIGAFIATLSSRQHATSS